MILSVAITLFFNKNEIRASTDEICYADEIFGYASDEIKFAIIFAKQIFHTL